MSAGFGTYTIKTSANAYYRLPVSGFGFIIDDVSAASASTVAVYTDVEGAASDYGVGDGTRAQFGTLYLMTVQDATVTLRIAFDPKTDFQEGTFNIGSTVTVAEEVVDVLDAVTDATVAAASSVVLAAASTARRLLGVRVPLSASGAVRVGGASVGAAAGWLLEPGEAIWLPGTAAISAYNPNASGVDLQLITVGVS